ncbi:MULTISPECIES: hypothetical protein [Actinomadura]|uniref:DUF5709 domain-containing protein n=1 Tax=Actinomadura litoris TaxID=2678616 RepID=A0A7K1L6I4_9ACTN|nr:MULTISPECIES: hypothetical protein [Actinomadura]MBT2213811.1 hypothetical protein [Actinomadura sp. NEAU-AAG7]MUN40032.1 hypothetical protein [Actinomadura litoris]
MSMRDPGADRDPLENPRVGADGLDDMGDDEQAEEIALTEQYVEDPPDDHVIEEPEESEDGVGITDYERRMTREGEDEPWPDADGPAESDAVNPTRRP